MDRPYSKLEGINCQPMIASCRLNLEGWSRNSPVSKVQNEGNENSFKILNIWTLTSYR